MEDNKNKKLQAIREKEIPNIISKYKTLIDNIMDEVSKPFPEFRNVERKDTDTDETVIASTPEEQLYNYILMREKAVDHTDRMLNKINMLEIELYAPDLLIEESKTEVELPKTSFAKRNAKKN